ncbi:MAG: vitamin K epoxide reductase family protein [Vicinamibacterales bacterium]
MSRSTAWYTAFASLGLAMASASTWVHYRLLNDPLYTSFCDMNATFSCTEAYSSRFGSVAGVPVALFGLLFFAFVLGLIVLCSQSSTAAPNLDGYVFASSTIGLAVVLYLGYASYVILKTVCVLCLGTYVAVIGLFLVSGAATRYPMTSLPSRLSRDLRTLLRTPKALSAAVVFVAAAVLSIALFPGQQASAAAGDQQPLVSQGQPAAPAASSAQIQQLEAFLAQQPRVPVMVPSDGADVVIVKFNDYQCPPCRQTYLEYKPIFAKWAREHPGKVKFMTRDYSLERQCNQFIQQDLHPSSCEAAVAVRLAREKGKAEQMEEWLFNNQPALTPEGVKAAAGVVAGVSAAEFEARFPKVLELVKGDIAFGNQLKVTGTPTFFMNGIRLPGLRAEFLDAAIAWELKQVQSKK